MQVLHFGAGNIGRGFIGKLLSDAGLKVTFADVNLEAVEALATRHEYTVNVVGEKTDVEIVTGVDAISSLSDDVIQKITCVDFITTAVGPQILTRIAVTIAKGLISRIKSNNINPLNIIACENMVRGTSLLKDYILAELPQQYHEWVEQHVGFVDSAVDRIVPPAVSESGDILEVTVETFSEWIIDKTQFKGYPPKIPGMELTDNLMAFVERKLFTLNTGHAITAYLGHYYGFTTIRDSILDKKVRLIVQGAMAESGQVLIQRYHFDDTKHQAYIDKIITRFENPYLLDDTDRVGRQPIRKLSVTDRLIKPLLGTFEYKTSHNNLLIGIAAALYYRNNDDDQAVELARMIDEHGVAKTLSLLSSIDINEPVIKKVADIYTSMQNRSF